MTTLIQHHNRARTLRTAVVTVSTLSVAGAAIFAMSKKLTWNDERGFVDAESNQRHQLVTNTSKAARIRDGRRLVECWNACAGIEDPAEAIREARVALFALLALRENGDVPSWTAQWEHAEKALAKLQPKEAE